MYMSYKFGAYFVSNPSYDLVLNLNLTHKDFVSYLFQFLIGGTILSIVTAVTTGIITFALLSAFRKNPSVNNQSVQAD